MTIHEQSLAERIEKQFPEGLTGILVPGATRTSYILEYNRNNHNPGKIEDMQHYMDYGMRKYRRLLLDFYELGGKNAILSVWSFWRFQERDPSYLQPIIDQFGMLISASMISWYQDNDIDPYFSGIDILLTREKNSLEYLFGCRLQTFQAQWKYKGSRVLVWEFTPMPLYTMFVNRANDTVAKNLEGASYAEMFNTLYQYYMAKICGLELPIPHFYLSTARDGSLKVRSHLFGLDLAVANFRMYFTPYPSFLMTREGLAAILEDLLNDKRVRSLDTDYRDKVTRELAQQMYAYFTQLAANPGTTLGLSKNLQELLASDNNEDK